MARDFIVVIPVADRPRQLSACLQSLAEQRRQFPYPGTITVVIAEDSLDPAHVARHRQLVRECDGPGLNGHHFGPEEQAALLAALPKPLAARLAGVLGEGRTPGHKGASLTRNLATLWLARQGMQGQLAWFIDSDQTFAVSETSPAGEERVRPLDYFRQFAHLFDAHALAILTGKVVGDPPVSPAVMAATLLADSVALLDALARHAPATACAFHAPPPQPAGDAAYHDMADLFGFRPATSALPYRCPLAGAHDHAATLAGFSRRLERFFSGEHPTRRSAWQPDLPADTVLAARTLYTGNYVFDPARIVPFIPFAALRLRMAGPTLGRLLRAELGPAFASANLPMQHGRALADVGRAECRPGVEHAEAGIDLSNEFERQYYGDVMLFGMEALIKRGYPEAQLAPEAVLEILTTTEAQLAARYQTRQTTLLASITALEARVEDRKAWWQAEAHAQARADLTRFITNLRRNFGPDAPAWRRIVDASARTRRLTALREAILRLPEERAAWQEAVERR